MRFLKAKGKGAEGVADQFAAYRQYLLSVKGSMPSRTFDFASAPWHYDYNDPRCPHDAWVESISLAEPATGERQENRSLRIDIRLLGAFHDGHIQLAYVGVHTYSGLASSGRDGHGDWLLDEVTVNTNGNVVHEVQFSSGACWIIECDEIQYEWCPLQRQPSKH